MSNEGVDNVNPELLMDAITRKNVGNQVGIACQQVNQLMKTIDAKCHILKDKRNSILLDVKEGLNNCVNTQEQLRKSIDNEITSLKEEQVELLDFAQHTEANYEIFKKELTEIYLATSGISPLLSWKMKQIIQKFELVRADITESMKLQEASLKNMYTFLEAHKEFSDETQESNSQNLMCLEYAREQLEKEINKVKCDLMESYETLYWALVNTKKSIDGEQFVTPVEANHESKHEALAEQYDVQKKEFHSTLESLINEIQSLVSNNSAAKTEMERARKNSMIMEKLDNIKLFTQKFACVEDQESNEAIEDFMEQE